MVGQTSEATAMIPQSVGVSLTSEPNVVAIIKHTDGRVTKETCEILNAVTGLVSVPNPKTAVSHQVMITFPNKYEICGPVIDHVSGFEREPARDEWAPVTTILWHVGTDPPKPGWYLASTSTETHSLYWDRKNWFGESARGQFNVIAWAEMPRPVEISE